MISKNIKIGLVTEAIGHHVSGGILAIIRLSNRLHSIGYNVSIFVRENDLTSSWIKCDVPIYNINSDEFKNFDGILVSCFSPVTQCVNDHKNASHRLLWMHSHETCFTWNGPEWCEIARKSYTLPNIKIFCVSTYLKIILEHMYNVKPLKTIVSPGIDIDIFKYAPQRIKPRIGFFNRIGQEKIRGTDIAVLGIVLAKQKFDFDLVEIPPINERYMMASALGDIDVYVDASRLAGSPTVVKEAMACGCIPITTHYGATDFVLHGYNGFIISPDSPKEIAQHINTIVNNMTFKERVDMSFRTSSYILNRYNWDEVVYDFLDVLEEVVKVD